MRIAFFSDNFYPELSGITDTIITTGKELTKRGHEICYVAPYYTAENYRRANREMPRRGEEDTIDGMPIVRLASFPLPISPTGQSRFVIPHGESIPFLKKFKPDLIHTQSPYGVGFEAMHAARERGIPLVGTNHTAIEDFFPLGEVMRSYDAWYYNHCDFVSAPYAGLISRMREKGFTKPGRAVPNPVDLSAFSPATPEEQRDHRTAFGITGPVVLYVGRLGIEKKIDVIVRSVALLTKEFPLLTFVATGHGAAEPRLRALAKELHIEANVRLTGFLSRATLPHIYKAADVFAMTSTSDSQSLALMQAYASGMPAVCARARGLPDYTPASCGFLIEPGNSRELADRLGELLRDKKMRARMGEAARAYSAQFSPDIIAREWEEIYKNVTAS